MSIEMPGAIAGEAAGGAFRVHALSGRTGHPHWQDDATLPHRSDITPLTDRGLAAAPAQRC